MPIDIKINTDRLDELIRRSSELHGRNEVPLTDLFPAAFMAASTKFQSIGAMIEASGIDPKDLQETAAWSTFVAANNNFVGWPDMLEAATAEWTKRKLFEGLK